MDFLNVIKTRASIRKYQDKRIPKEILDKIVDAGIWGPSVPSFLQIQPWRFVVILKKETRLDLARIILNKSKESAAGVNVLLSSAAKMIKNAPVIIVVYNSNDLDKMKDKFKTIYEKFQHVIKTAQVSAISAAIQNMILVAENEGIGSCWLDTPFFCKKEINEFLNTSDDLLAILTFGYPAEEGKRSKRKPFDEIVQYVS